jgi:hypothetical protein
MAAGRPGYSIGARSGYRSTPNSGGPSLQPRSEHKQVSFGQGSGGAEHATTGAAKWPPPYRYSWLPTGYGTMR